MFPSEGLNDISEDPTSEIGDDAYFEDDDIEESQVELAENETDQKDVVDPSHTSQSARSPITKSLSSSAHSDGRRGRFRNPHEHLHTYGSVSVKRDPAIESIIESRQFSIIENPYTRLAQVTSQPTRLSQRSNQFELPIITESDTEMKVRSLSSRNKKKISALPTAELDKQEWDDGLIGEHEKESVPALDKSGLQIYEETCARLNVCPCSIIVRSLNTTEINLRNYGLGPRGCAALAASLIHNTTVLSLNLSANNIGNGGMAYVYQIFTENIYIEEYDLSFNNLGTKGIRKLADAIPQCAQLKTLSVAGNELSANDIKFLLSQLEDHPNLKDLNISHNQLDEIGGKYVAEWLTDNNFLLNFDISWCSIRLMGAKALAKAIGDNNKLISLDLSYNSFTNDTIESLTTSLTRNMSLCELNLHGNQFICRYDATIKENPSLLITGKDSQIYKMLISAATNQSLKIFRLGRNHIDTRCLMIMLESLSQMNNITLEELDLTGLTITAKQTSKIDLLFLNHSKLRCYVGPVRQTVEHFTNYLLDLINMYCEENAIALSDIFNPNEGTRITTSIITYEQFLNGLRKAKIPFPIAHIDDIMKYLGRDNEPGQISLRSINIGIFEIFLTMNGNNNSNNSMCNQNQIPKNLPLKKRRAYIIDTPTIDIDNSNGGQHETYSTHRSTTIKQTMSQEDPLQIYLPTGVTSTPPSSPHLELLRQQYAYLMANSTNNQHENTFSSPASYECLMAQKVLAQQFLDNYRTLYEQQYQNQTYGYKVVEGTHTTIDEHFRKSLGNNYNKFTGGFLTPEDSSSNSSPTERTPVDSIEEHFARSLGKFWPLTTPSNEDKTSSTTESVVDDHFAKALGATTWEKLKEKS
ncbi:unnamed protein product [Rotaria sp. Silwood1]|nr:unnamed protein product [Rotaria sp. Silwood1]